MTMKHFYLFIFSIAISISAGAQCAGNRYVKQIFDDVDTTVDITYGSNINQAGNSQSLELDVFTPNGDVETSRPLLILAHGGSFVSGSKEASDVVSLCNDFARMGYVTSSIEYRLGMDGIPFPGPDSVAATEAVIRAYHDMKAAIRFFYKDARENGNTYGVDTNQIYIGGSSAGAIAAVHVAYLDDIAEMPTSYIDTTEPGLGGGLAGLSGNQGYPSDIQGVVSLAGAIRDTSWMQAGDVPIISLHADNDETVPYLTEVITLFGTWDIVTVSGSGHLHPRCDNLGITNCLFTLEGSNAHPVHVASAAYYDTTVMFVRNFLSSMVCGTTLDCYNTTSIVGVDDHGNDLSAYVSVYPNPANNVVNIDLAGLPAGNHQLILRNNVGQIIAQQQTSGTRTSVDLTEVPSGYYHIEIIGENWRAVKGLVK